MSLVVVSVALSACSLILVDGPPPTSQQQPDRPLDCTKSRLVPAIDTAIAALATVGAIYFLVEGDDQQRTLGTAVEAGLAAGFGFSAYKGFTRTSRCREAVAGRISGS